jgi:glycosyltransferase involved in cell wall biosynthesis
MSHRDSATPATKLFPWPGLRSQHQWDVLRNTLALWRAVRQFRPDILHSFSRAAYLLPLLLRYRSSHSALRLIMSYQRKPGVKQVARAAKLAGQMLAFTGCSEHICLEGRKGGGTWQAIHNCVELDKYTYQPTVPADAPLVFLSRVERIKGAHTAIALAKRNGRRLLIAGNHGQKGEEGWYWDEEILPQLGRDGIEYVGPVDDGQKNKLLGQAAAILVPIEWDEPFGIVFAEALACGTPVISCPRGALPEIIRDGVDGFLVNSHEEGCAAVAKLPAINRMDCRQRAEAKFSSKVIAEEYLCLYSELLRGRNAR